MVFFPIDFSRAELKWAIDLIEKVSKEGHMDPPTPCGLRRGKPAFAEAPAGQARLRPTGFGGASALALVNTFGVLSPHAIKYFVTFLLGRIVCGEPVPTSPDNAPGAEPHQEAAGGALPPGLRHGRRQHHHGAVAKES